MESHQNVRFNKTGDSKALCIFSLYTMKCKHVKIKIDKSNIIESWFTVYTFDIINWLGEALVK